MCYGFTHMYYLQCLRFVGIAFKHSTIDFHKINQFTILSLLYDIYITCFLFQSKSLLGQLSLDHMSILVFDLKVFVGCPFSHDILHRLFL